ncbi:Leucinostatins biosynthesis cluster protein T like [Verticillium longisporum]|uniref:Leucinostatins biosynthesis cluster protein T like n=1 Tax=Verticillium longisporum TaxID=100787 RepID=A0A8I2ZBP2_VERLO|nr:Leucinostatins biosynthesis cluster protein T like [Verticillium longisporum]
MHLILTGATGLVGTSVLNAMLKTNAITKISILSRRPVPMAQNSDDPRVEVIIHKDFAKYEPEVMDKLQGATGAVWALGVSQTQASKEDYVTITKDYPLAAAKAFANLASADEPFRFVYVSAGGATQTPGFLTPYYGVVKGEAETLLSELRLLAFAVPADDTSHGGADEGVWGDVDALSDGAAGAILDGGGYGEV